MPADPATLDRLRRRIARLERAGPTAGNDTARLTFGLAAVDGHLPWGGLPAACVHEIVDGDAPAAGRATPGGAATAFAAALAGRRQQASGCPAVWIAPRRDPHESLYRHGLTAFGLIPETLLVVRIPGSGRGAATQALWAMEECLRERAIGLVCAEIDTLGLAASRRLQLAAAAGGTTGLLLRGDAGAPPPTASVTRWRVVAAPAFDFTVPRWRVELLRARNGRPRHWLLEWRHDSDLPAPDASRPGERPAAGFSLAAPLRDRPDLPAPLPRAGEDRQRAA